MSPQLDRSQIIIAYFAIPVRENASEKKYELKHFLLIPGPQR